MKMQMQTTVNAIKRYDFEGNKGGNIYTLGEPINEPDFVGSPTMKMSCNYEVLESIRDAGFPGEFELQIEIRPGAKDGIKQHCVAAKPLRSQAKQPEPSKS